MFKTLFNYHKINLILIKNSHRVLALMLLSLHAFLIWGNEQTYLKQTLFLGTYALFLLWQPIWRSTEKLSPPALVIFIGVGIIGRVHQPRGIVIGRRKADRRQSLRLPP